MDNLKLEIARTLYIDKMKGNDAWHAEQEHVRDHYLGLAQRVLNAIRDAGYVVVLASEYEKLIKKEEKAARRSKGYNFVTEGTDVDTGVENDG